ncbi:MAG: hypothetical protein WBN96_11425 [Gammaproteobacteria bacterium]
MSSISTITSFSKLRGIGQAAQIAVVLRAAMPSSAATGKNFRVFSNIFLLLIILLVLAPGRVFALAGDAISNISTIDYVIGGITQTQESSPTGNTVPGVGNGTPTTFLEDRVINFTITTLNATAVPVTSGQANVFASFSLSNTSNSAQDFLLTALNTATNPYGAPVDTIDPLPPLSVFVENGVTAGYQPTDDTAVFVDELAPLGSATIYVVATMPVASPGDVAAITLVAQVASAGAAGEGAAITNDSNNRVSPAGTYSNGGTSVVAGTAVNVADTLGEETVFNDPAGAAVEDLDSAGAVQDIAGNGQHSDSSAFQVQASPVTINKTVSVIDTLGGTDPHPGATLRYQLDVVITGASNINNLLISDTIPANTTYVTSSIVLNGVPQTDAAFGVDAIDYAEFNGTDVIVDLSQGGVVAVTPGTPNIIIFDVTID